MVRQESAVTRSERPILLIAHRDGDRHAIVSAAHEAGLLPRMLPNPERARVHLARDERFDLLVASACLDAEELVALVSDARRLRSSLPILIVARDPGEAAGVEARLADAALAGPLPRVAVPASQGALAVLLERSIPEHPSDGPQPAPASEHAA